jgi:hypothetical protein
MTALKCNGVTAVFVRITIMSALMIPHVVMAGSVIRILEDVLRQNVRLMRYVMANAVLMVGVFHVRNVPVNLEAVLVAGTVFVATARNVSANRISNVLEDLDVIVIAGCVSLKSVPN